MRLSALLGLLFFSLVVGLRVVDPRYLNWVMEGDISNHFLGWAFFRNEPWSFPLGQIHSYMSPIGSNIVYTDSIPVLALTFKLFGSFFPIAFQYLGFWLLLCFVLQFVYAFRIFESFGFSKRSSLLGAILIGTAPVLVQRLGHSALCAHWMILAGMDLYFRQKKEEFPRFFWLLFLNALAVLVHAYLWVMVFAITMACYLKSFLDHPRRWKALSVALFALFSNLFLIFWSVGYFSKSEIGGTGYGFYTSDLLAFFNSLGTSRFLPPIRFGAGYAEGFAYLGLGGIFLFLASSRELWRKKRVSRDPLVWVCLLLAFFSMALSIRIANHSLFSVDWFIPALKPVLSALRASGRFVWPLYYLTFIGIIRFVLKSRSNQVAHCLLGLAIVMQGLDFSLYTSVHLGNSPFIAVEMPPTLSSKVRELIFVPPVLEGCRSSFSRPVYTRLALIASQMSWSMNSGYTSRADRAAEARYCDELISQLRSHHFDTQRLYVFDSDHRDLAQSPQLKCVWFQDAELCVARQ